MLGRFSLNDRKIPADFKREQDLTAVVGRKCTNTVTIGTDHLEAGALQGDRCALFIFQNT